MDCSPASDTITLVEPEIVPEEAVMVAVPAATPVTRPVLLLTAAIVPSDVDQNAATEPVVPSSKVPVASICAVHTEPAGQVGGVPLSAAIVGVGPKLLDTAMEVSVAFTKNPLQPATSKNTTVAKANHTRLDRP